MAAERTPVVSGWEAFAIVRRDARLLLLLAAVSLVARILYLGRADLWCDEILFINMASPPHTPWQAFVSHWQQFVAIGHMPLGAVMHNVTLWLVGAGAQNLDHQAFLQRLPAVLWGTLQVPLVYVLAALVASRREALTAAVLMAVSTFPVFFAREAYYYAPLMLWATVALVVFLSVVRAGRLTRRAGWALVVTLAITTLCHVGGITIALGALLVVTVCLMLNRYPSPLAREDARRLYGRLWLLCAAGAAVGVPFFMQRITHPSTQVWQAHPTVLQAVHDFLGKALVGTNLPQGLLAWVLVALGLIAILRRGEGRPLRLVLLGLFLVPFSIVLFSSLHTLYFARYFNNVLALYYVIVALGLGALVDLAARIGAPAAPWKKALHPVLLAALVAPHLFIYLPQIYALPAKGVNYGGIARWLNANLQPGTPYVMESAYEMRFTSGFFPTPNLVAAAPYVHGAGAAEMQRLRSAQQSFLQHFPDAPFVESARTGTEPGAPYGTWNWPHEHFQRRADVDNHPLQRLAAWGIWPQVPLNQLSDIQYHTPILYNTAEDVVAAARQRGEWVLIHFGDWEVRPIQQGVYAHVKQSAWGALTTTNLADHSLRGHFVLQGVVIAPEQSYEIQVKWMGQLLGQTTRWGGQAWSLETGEVVVPRREGRLEWGIPADQAKGVRALILQDARFVPSPAVPAAEPATNGAPLAAPQ